MNLEQKIISGTVIFFIGSLFGSYTDDDKFAISLIDMLPALATLFAAFIGAKYAFLLQNNKTELLLKKNNISAGNLAIFKVLRKINILLSYQQQAIDPVRKRDAFFLEMSPTLHLLTNDSVIDFGTLSFLLSGTKEPNILGDLAICEARFQSALDSINERSKIHREQVQPSLEKSGIIEGGEYTLHDLEKAMGNRLYVTLNKITPQVIAHVDDTIEDLRDIGNRLSLILENLYPESQIIKISSP